MDATRIANEIGNEISLPRIAGRQICRANALADGVTTKDYFRVNVAIPFINHLELLDHISPIRFNNQWYT